MTVLVKICGMTDEAAVHAAVEAGADALGFVFYAPSPRNLEVARAARLASLVPDGVLTVAVMLHPERALWDAVQQELAPDVLQTDIGDFAALDVGDEVQQWPVLREGSVPAVGDLPGLFVYEGRQSGRGETVDWDRAADVARRGRMILAGGLDAGNVAEAIRRVAPYGVDVSSAVESRPGVKDAARIRAFVDAARAAGH